MCRVARRVRPLSCGFAAGCPLELLVHRAAQGMRTQCTDQSLRADLRHVSFGTGRSHLPRIGDSCGKDHRAGHAGPPVDRRPSDATVSSCGVTAGGFGPPDDASDHEETHAKRQHCELAAGGRPGLGP